MEIILKDINFESVALKMLGSGYKADILGYAAIVSVEVAVVPLVTAVVLARAVCPAVVAAHGNDVLAFLDVWRKVKAACHHTVLTVAQMMAVEVEVGALAYALELYKVFLVGIRDIEELPVPYYRVGKVNDVLTESLVAVEGIGQGYLLPLAVVKLWLAGLCVITYMQSPCRVEVLFASVCRTGGDAQCHR